LNEFHANGKLVKGRSFTFIYCVDQNVYVTEICRVFTYLTQNLIFMNMIITFCMWWWDFESDGHEVV